MPDRQEHGAQAQLVRMRAGTGKATREHSFSNQAVKDFIKFIKILKQRI